jgi:hypothetical protein
MDTAVSQMGVQRPQIQLDLRGQGAVPLTWLAAAAATLEMPSNGWRCFVTNAAESLLIAEAIPKPRQKLPLALSPGLYALKCRADGERLMVARFSAAAGDRVVGDMLGFAEVPLENAYIVRKGGSQSSLLNWRHSRPDSVPVTTQQPSPWSFTVTLQGEAELRKRVMAPSLIVEALGEGTARWPNVRLGGAFTTIIQPNPGFRLEGRVHPHELRLSATSIRPHLSLGATAFLPDTAIGGHIGLGVAFHTGTLQFSTGIAYERFFNPGEHREPHAVLLALGAGWAPFAARLTPR